MIVVLIEAAERWRPLGMLQLTVLDAVFPAGPGSPTLARCIPKVASWFESDGVSG